MPFVARKVSKIIKENKINIVHVRSRAPAWMMKFIPIKNFKTVSTFHNIYGTQYFLKQKYNQAMSKFDHVVAISNYVKMKITELYGINANKISVIHHGYPDSLETIKIPDEFLEKPFLLFVGDRNNYKNFKNFILAYSKSKMLKNDFNVVCFGGGEILDNEKKIFLDHNILDKIKIYYGDDKKLNYLFKKAAVYVCPSLYEGFGLTFLTVRNKILLMNFSD